MRCGLRGALIAAVARRPPFQPETRAEDHWVYEASPMSGGDFEANQRSRRLFCVFVKVCVCVRKFLSRIRG